MHLIEQIKTLLPKIHGWCSIEKATKFVEIILEHKPTLCVEIGVFGGSSLIPQALALQHNNHGVVYGIDPWTKSDALEEMISEENKEWWGKLDLEEIYNHCFNHILTLDLNNHCKLLRDKSENVVNNFQDNDIDLLHIDGNHSEALSYKDAVLYLPKVKSGGHIFFDDIWWTEGDSNVTTRKAILYLLESCDRLDLVADCLVLRKR